jgi:L-serine/L-threonine ammonia-lyase
MKDPERAHFYTSSGGNAGLGCVHAANFVGRPSTVVVPTSTKPMMIAKLRAAGATQVIQHGAHWSEADRHLREVVMKAAASQGEQPVYVPPFDHPDVWQGHSSLVQELAAQFVEQGIDSPPDLIVCSVGGGGLFNGIVQGIDAQGEAWSTRTKILAMETAGADALAQSLAAGKRVTLPAITSLATSLGAVQVCERTFELAERCRKSGMLHNAVLTDAEAAMGCWRFADDERMLVELACGVSLAVCYNRLEAILGRPVAPQEKVIIVVCGGSAVSVDMVEAWRKQYGDLNDHETGDGPGIVPSAANVPFRNGNA